MNNRNLIESFYIHSHKWNFYDNAGVPEIKGTNTGKDNRGIYKDLEKLRVRIENLYNDAAALENKFYQQLETYSHITKEQFIRMYKEDQFRKDNIEGLNEEEIYKAIKRDVSLEINTQEIAMLMAGIDKKASEAVVEQLLKEVDNKQAGAFKELYSEHFMKASLTNELYKALNNKSSYNFNPDTIRTLFMGKIRQNATSRSTAQRWAKAIKEKTQSVSTRTANMRLKKLIKNKFDTKSLEYGVEPSKYWDRYWEDFTKAVEDVTNKSYNSNIQISADINKGTGDVLEISLKLMNDSIFCDLIKTEMIGSTNRTKTLKNRDIDKNISTIEKTGQSRTDVVINIYKDSEHKQLAGSYGIQLKNSFLDETATMHLQSSILLNTLLTTALEASLVSEKTYYDIFYLLANIFWFNQLHSSDDDNFMYTPRGSKNNEGKYPGIVGEKKIDENNIINYVNILLQQVCLIVLEPQVRTELKDTIYKESKEKSHYGNVFYVYKNNIIPVSWFFKGMLAFIDDFVNNKKTSNINDILTIRKVSLANAKVAFGGTSPGALWGEKRNYINGLDENTRHRTYPQGLINIGKKPGEKFYNTAKITGVNAFVNIQELEKHYFSLHS